MHSNKVKIKNYNSLATSQCKRRRSTDSSQILRLLHLFTIIPLLLRLPTVNMFPEAAVHPKNATFLGRNILFGTSLLYLCVLGLCCASICSFSMNLLLQQKKKKNNSLFLVEKVAFLTVTVHISY